MMHQGGMSGKVGLKLFHGHRPIGPVIAHADGAPF